MLHRYIDGWRWAASIGKLHVLLGAESAPGSRLPAWRVRFTRWTLFGPCWTLKVRWRSKVWLARVEWARWEF
jgi:hypothetical protein